MNTKLIVSNVVLIGGLLTASSAQASVTWDIVADSIGQPDLVGVMITPDRPVFCPEAPPDHCPISGWLTIPEGSLSGPGTTINLAVDPTTVHFSVSDPPNDGDGLFLFEISKDGYTCDSTYPYQIQCDFDGTSASYDIELTEGAPRVVIGNGDVWISDELQVGGQVIGSVADTTCSVAECNEDAVTILTCGETQVEIACAAEPPEPVTYAIGDEGPGGGIVFYVTDGGQHGLEAAPAEQETTAPWCPSPNDNTDIGGIYNVPQEYIPDGHSGAHNTPLIAAVCVAGAASAAEVAAAYEWRNGQMDGFLPNKEELDLLYQNQAVVGGFADAGYWSSSEVGGGSAWYQGFDDGFQGNGIKNVTARVRAARAF